MLLAGSKENDGTKGEKSCMEDMAWLHARYNVAYYMLLRNLLVFMFFFLVCRRKDKWWMVE